MRFAVCTSGFHANVFQLSVNLIAGPRPDHKSNRLDMTATKHSISSMVSAHDRVVPVDSVAGYIDHRTLCRIGTAKELVERCLNPANTFSAVALDMQIKLIVALVPAGAAEMTRGDQPDIIGSVNVTTFATARAFLLRAIRCGIRTHGRQGTARNDDVK